MANTTGCEIKEARSGSLEHAVSIVREELEWYENMINHGKGKWPKPGYVRDSIWNGWMGARHALRTMLRKLEDATDGTQRPGTRDATIANPDAMPGSLE